ncbi:MAG: YdiU family protein [Turicibacter sp.]|nr:YdiU family protein [Turicibacter sp.]
MSGWNLDNSYARLPRAFYKEMDLSPVAEPKLVKFNEKLAEELGLPTDGIDAGWFTGNVSPKGSQPLAQAYAGHQFGYFNMLGDGRALLLGEQLTPDGKRVDIQLKGSGRTPYSRSGDGRAALGPMLREYLISEAMHGLGIPTTRSLAVAATGEITLRERPLPGAILTRVADSHIRVGTFAYASEWATEKELKALADYTMERHFGDIPNKGDYLAFLHKIAERQGKLIAQWQLVGFVHGVMNTDNMAIAGETIDYGPCAFMDSYDPDSVYSSIDREGRYAYKNQPVIGAWNLARLTETMLPFISLEAANEVIRHYWRALNAEWLEGMGRKLGIFKLIPEDESLFDDLLALMKELSADYTNTFVAFTFEEEIVGLKNWRKRWQNRLEGQPQSWEESQALMKKNNPQVIPRNHKVEEALMLAEHGDMGAFDKLLEAVQNPYESGAKEFMEPAEPGVCYKTYCGT